jgi:hypothetical protein
VHETAGVTRRAWPLTFGLPLPRGLARDAARLRVRAEAGADLPVQARILSRWDDGSVRWVLVDTQVDTEARQRRDLTVDVLAASAALPKSPPLRVFEESGGVSVDTGALRFAVPRARFALLDAGQAAGRPVAGPIVATMQMAGATAVAQPPRRIAVLERGPLRARVRLEGAYGNGFEYVIRLDAFAGQPFVRVLSTFVNRNAAPSTAVQRIGFRWPLRSTATSEVVWGIEGSAPKTQPRGAAGTALVQPDNTAYVAGGVPQSGRLAGWMAVREKATEIGVAARWFWQQYPQSIRANADGVEYDAWAPEVRPAQVGTGAAKTHEWSVWLDTGGATAERGAALNAPLVAAVDPVWVARSAALPNAVACEGAAAGLCERLAKGVAEYRARNDAEPWDDRGTVQCASADGEVLRTGAYGMWNWGDWNFRTLRDRTKGCDAWGNLEYDTTQVLALAFAATGDPATHEMMETAARHFMDVDVIHFHPQRPEWVGMNHPKNPLHFSFELGGPDLGHTWTEGLLSYYYLTGDERALDAARGIGDYLARRADSIVRRGNPRQWGWPQIALAALFAATGEQKYRDAALDYARGALRAHPSERVENWKAGILAEALTYSHALSRDTKIADWLTSYARAVVGREITDARMYPAVAYVAALTGDAKLRAAALARADALEIGGWGKPFTLNSRIAFRIYSLLAGRN